MGNVGQMDRAHLCIQKDAAVVQAEMSQIVVLCESYINGNSSDYFICDHPQDNQGYVQFTSLQENMKNVHVPPVQINYITEF